jgi:hypothetical protein
MLFQLGLEPTMEFIVWLIIGTIILGLMIFLATWIIVSKSKAKDKLIMGFIAALIAILIIPLVAGAIGQVLTAIGSIPESFPWSGHNFMGLLVPVVQFLLFLILIKLLMSEDWGHATWITLIAMFLLYFLYSCLPILYEFIGSVI